MTYEAFIFLNNVGVALLQHHQYQEAMITFQDAVRVHRSFHYSQQQQPTIMSKQNNEQMMIQEFIRNASERLENSHPINNNNIITNDPIIIIDIANDDSLRTILRYGSSMNQIDFVIRINSMNDPFTDADNDWKLHYAILILNFGIACKKRSTEVGIDDSTDDNINNSLQNQSTQLFHIANQIASEELSKLTDDSKIQLICNNQNNLLSIIHMMMISMLTSSYIRDILHSFQYSTNNDEMMILCHNAISEKEYNFFVSLIKQYIQRSCDDGSIQITKYAAAVA